MGYAIRKDGQGWRAVSGPGDVGEGETFSATAPAPIPENPILAKIAALEGDVTNRRLREAALTDEGKAWLAKQDAAIAALRAKL